MTSTTTYKTENGKTVKVESETEKGGSTEKIEKTVTIKNRNLKAKQNLILILLKWRKSKCQKKKHWSETTAHSTQEN